MEWFLGHVLRIHGVEDLWGSGQKKFVPDLAAVERVRVILKTMRGKVAEMPDEDDALHEPVDDALLGRLLIASDFDMRKTAVLVGNYRRFRLELGGGVRPPPGADSGTFRIPFEDRLGRPVLIVRGSQLNPALLEHYQLVFRSFMDTIIAHFLQRRISSGGEFLESNPLEQYVCMVETEGARTSNVSAALVKMLVSETSVYYPDRLQEVIVLGVNPVIRAIWTLVSPLLHPRTRKKVRLLGRREVRPALQKLVEPHVLPCGYGGAAPPLPTRGLEANVGAVAAATWRRLGVDPVGSGSRGAMIMESQAEHAPETACHSCFAGCWEQRQSKRRPQ